MPDIAIASRVCARLDAGCGAFFFFFGLFMRMRHAGLPPLIIKIEFCRCDSIWFGARKACLGICVVSKLRLKSPHSTQAINPDSCDALFPALLA